MRQQIAKLNYLHMAPRKVRLIADTLKGLPVNEAEAQLLVRPHRAAKPLLKLLRSAAANARHNQKLNTEAMIIRKIIVDQGPMLKRFLPRAMGRATPIHKKMSRITLVLEESAKTIASRFKIAAPKKEKKPVKPAKALKPKITGAEKEEKKPKGVGGFFRRLFRRKTV